MRELLNCAVASSSGAAALREFGLSAKPVLCSAMAWLGDSITQIGHSPESAYEGVSKLRARLRLAPLTHEHFVAAWERHHDAEYPHHVVIEAMAPSALRTFIDPTASQLGNGTGLRIPLQASWSGALGDGRFMQGGGGWEYGPCPHPDRIDLKYLDAVDDALVRNYTALMQMALEARLDPSAFREALMACDPLATARADRFMAAIAAKYGNAW